jgi:hypothetical protein
MSYHVEEDPWVPMSAREAGTGRNLGGPVTQLACRLYSLGGQPWPRLRLAAFPGPAGPEASAWYKAADEPDLGWDAVPIPDQLLEEAMAVLKEAFRNGRWAPRIR